jgi:phage N-6-adenine-methyltransferase
MVTGAAFRRGKSKQDYETPATLICAVESRFGPITFDLAASAYNAKADKYCTEADDALTRVVWPSGGLLWLNPPFANIRPWARKCCDNRASCKIAFLVPASVGSEWFAQYVFDKALVLFLSPRISFDGMEPYPKDCILAMYGWEPGFQLWHGDWAL